MSRLLGGWKYDRKIMANEKNTPAEQVCPFLVKNGGLATHGEEGEAPGRLKGAPGATHP